MGKLGGRKAVFCWRLLLMDGSKNKSQIAKYLNNALDGYTQDFVNEMISNGCLKKVNETEFEKDEEKLIKHFRSKEIIKGVKWDIFINEMGYEIGVIIRSNDP